MTNKKTIALFFQNYGGLLAFVVAATATLGSLYFSEIAGFVPCTLCWYQRILMYPLTLITLVGIIEKDEYLPLYVLPLSIIGMGVSGYHVLVQKGVFSNATSCTVGVPCSLSYVNYLGFITIPVMAFTAFLLISILMLVTRKAFVAHPLANADSDEDEAEDTEITEITEENTASKKWWLPVSIISLLLLFLGLAAFRTDNSPQSIQFADSPSITGPITGEMLFQQPTFGNAPGCIACHSLEPGIILVGPSLAGIATQVEGRIPGKSSAEYLRESIIDPNAYIPDGFTEGVMYQNYGDELTEEQVDKLVSYLLTLE
jgi:disulfide bond formation protein DsbB